VILRLSDSRNAAALEAARAHVADRLNTVKAETSECEALQENPSPRHSPISTPSATYSMT